MGDISCFNGTKTLSDCLSWTVKNNCNISSAEGYGPPIYYSYRYRAVGTFFQGVVFIIGLFGNTMFVTIVCRNRSMRSPTNCYLVSLAIADLLVLIAAIPENILSYYLIGRLWVFGDVGCALFIFLQYLGINSSTLSLVAFTVERYTAICHPMKAQKVCTLKRAKRIIGITWLVAALYCSPWLVLATTKPLHYKGFEGLKKCDFTLPRNQYLIYFFTDLVVFYITPLVLTCILYGLIARTLYTRMMVNSSSMKSTVQAEAKSRIQVVKMLALVVAVFAVLWLPYRGLLVYNSLASLYSRDRFMNLWYLMFAKTCVFINSAINPILYSAMSSKFRRGFQKLLICRKTSRTQSISSGRTTKGQSNITELI
ncbi:thyrotropin-releasing hormone receptor-like [Lycorma delicatula]|uniref:thyrotropin-releasing hormone receptor-like n=1 Tax=Lycorma delicatula TaxID=130591 RepID=UPI003F515B4F